MATLRELFNHFNKIDPAVLDFELGISDPEALSEFGMDIAYKLDWQEYSTDSELLVLAAEKDYVEYESAPLDDDDDDDTQEA